MSTVLVNPDCFLEQPAGRVALALSPASMRRKLKEQGLDPTQARAPKPYIPAVKCDFQQFAKISNQQRWTRMMVSMVSGGVR